MRITVVYNWKDIRMFCDFIPYLLKETMLKINNGCNLKLIIELLIDFYFDTKKNGSTNKH